MSRIKPLNPNEAKGKAKQLLDGVQAELGMTPNLMKTMAHSPAVLEAYLNFSGALASVALNILTNYFNHVAQTEIDFPQVPLTLNET